MTATKILGRPLPLRNAAGNIIAHFSLRITNELFCSGEKLLGGPFDLDALIGSFSFKSCMLHPSQRLIGTILVAPEDCSPLDEFTAADILDVWSSGEGIMVLASSAAARGAACRHITDLLERAQEIAMRARGAR